MVGFALTDTHQGQLKLGQKVLEPTGRVFRARMAASFGFKPGSDKTVCEHP